MSKCLLLRYPTADLVVRASDIMSSVNFQSAFCTRYRCLEADFERQVFWRGLYRHAVPLAVMLRWFAPRFFHVDVEFIRWLAGAVTMSDIREDLQDFEYRNRVNPQWLRTGFLIRLSPARIKALARQCLPMTQTPVE